MIKRLLNMVGVVLLMFGAYWGFNHFKSHPIFNVQTIIIDGLSKIPVESLALDSLKGSPMKDVDLVHISDSILQEPWIEGVSIKRKWPNTLHIQITEETPQAILVGDKLQYVNKKGQLFKKLSPEDDRDFPLITGITANNPKLISKSLEFLKKIEENNFINTVFADEISEIGYDNVNGFSIYLLNSGLKLILGESLSKDKIDRLAVVAQDIASRQMQVAAINLNFEDRAIIKMIQERSE